jgi:hypothetical protein
MTKEAEDQIRTVSQTSKTAIDNRKQFIFIYWGGILDLLFDVAMTKFFWVDLWRIRGQPFHHNLSMLSEVDCNLFTPVDGRPVPYQNPAPRHMPSPMVERLNYPLTIDSPIEMTFIDFAGKCEPDGCRKHPSLTGYTTQNRALPAWSPGRPQGVQERKAGFIKQHNFCADSTRFFLFGANHGGATLLPTYRFVRRHGALDTVDSSQVFSRNGSDNQDERRYQTRV